MTYKRYAIFYTLPPGPFAEFGAAWLGWDVALGRQVEHLQIDGLDVGKITKAPRKYGFHATLKPPFALADGQCENVLSAQFDIFCEKKFPVTLGAFELVRLGSFLALVPNAPIAALTALAADVVEHFDGFRAPMDTEELARRRARNLSPAQDQMLLRWGYPFVMQEFRFHLTLTGRMPRRQAAEVQKLMRPLITPMIVKPFKLDALSLMGEDENGWFHLIKRRKLGR